MPLFDRFSYLDPLYGDVVFDGPISRLIHRPLLQRLRHVRLSNIDSLQMPGISGITRFEHALGTAYLATRVGFSSGLPIEDRTLLQAAALAHDSAITPYGHLLEEALQYASTEFHHEDKWSLLMASGEQEEFGGIDHLQLFLHKTAGLTEWASQTFRGDYRTKLTTLVKAIQGAGPLGRFIAGDVDLDNIDNVTRIAFHMGLRPDLGLPQRLCSKMQGLSIGGDVLFEPSAVAEVEEWSRLRRVVYDHLMPSPLDFVGKIMLLSSCVAALESNLLDKKTSWKMTDYELIGKLLNSDDTHVKETAERWQLGDLWEMTDLIWLSGDAPGLVQVGEFSSHLSAVLGRQFFCYRIKDKRDRELTINLIDGGSVRVGQSSKQWLFGAASPVRKPFSPRDNERIAVEAEAFFNAAPCSPSPEEGLPF